MFDDVDKTIVNLFKLELKDKFDFDISYAIPNKDFKVVGGTKTTLSFYLYDIRENRDLRDVAPVRQPSGGRVTKIYPPARVKLSYCLSAWSPATPGADAADPAMAEHQLLGRVLKILLKYPTLPTAALVGSLAAQDIPIPTTVILPEDHKASRDFWNSVGGTLRPILDYSVTVPVPFADALTGPATSAVRIHIGDDSTFTFAGAVWDNATPPNAVAGAWVRVAETGQTSAADADGHFLFERVPLKTCTLVCRAVGFLEAKRSISVPQPDGNYDLQLVSL
jgi:hypothetical protein